MGFRDMCPRPARSLLGGCGGREIFQSGPLTAPSLFSLVTAIEPLCVCEIVNVCVCVCFRVCYRRHITLVLRIIPRHAVGPPSLSDLRSLSTRPSLFRSVKEVASTETRPAVPVVLPTLRLAVATRVRRCGGLGRAQWPRAR